LRITAVTFGGGSGKEQTLEVELGQAHQFPLPGGQPFVFGEQKYADIGRLQCRL
jgi:hypothetical protein